eukprot:CAMPEP_0113614816 /NCGR_PEP_ID=MMETSP0017_2-20120614/7370_1 /TAXON_ID=2856 /ORGANISM="Cylindrotheca closterium" /LENGTH=470 /DNA_ID=CAMNT_0000524013 /DNA_START=167 /DNA_END=1579 /DNA_ORIENTATION=- /assembly_acc=CAM_ASM_000147
MPPNIEDPYAVLGIANDATEIEVKKAYRKLALKYHPDRQNGKSEEEIAAASEMFVKIAEAQDLLTDPVKKYDFRMKQEAQEKKGSSPTAASSANRGRPTAPPSSSVRRSPNRPATGRPSPGPFNRQGSGHSMNRARSPRSNMNRKQQSVRVAKKPGIGRNNSDQAPRRVNSLGSLATRSAHVPRTNPNRSNMQQNTPFNPHKPHPMSQNRSKTANMLRTPSNASMMSKKKKPTQTIHSPDNTYTFERNNGSRTPPAKAPSSEDGSAKPKKKKKKKKPEPEPEPEATFTFVRNNNNSDIPKKKKKKKKKPEVESEFTFVRNNNTNSAAVESSMKMRRRHSIDSGKKQMKAEKRKQMNQQQAQSARFNGNGSRSNLFKPGSTRNIKKPGSSKNIMDPSSRSLKQGSSKNIMNSSSRSMMKPRNTMMSPQKAPKKSILGFGRSSVQQTPQSAKGKKKTMGIKGFLGRPPVETS